MRRSVLSVHVCRPCNRHPCGDSRCRRHGSFLKEWGGRGEKGCDGSSLSSLVVTELSPDASPSPCQGPVQHRLVPPPGHRPRAVSSLSPSSAASRLTKQLERVVSGCRFGLPCSAICTIIEGPEPWGQTSRNILGKK